METTKQDYKNANTILTPGTQTQVNKIVDEIWRQHTNVERCVLYRILFLFCKIKSDRTEDEVDEVLFDCVMNFGRSLSR